MCFRTKSGPLNFLPDNGQSHLSLASSCVLAATNFSTSLKRCKKKSEKQWTLFLKRMHPYASVSFKPSLLDSSSFRRLTGSKNEAILLSKVRQ
jgi:hypothetical protein